MVWQVLKNGMPIGVFTSPEEAEKCYAEFEADEIREIDEEVYG